MTIFAKFPRVRTLTLKVSSFRRLRLIVGTFIVTLLSYQFLPQLLFKVPASKIGWQDVDFEHVHAFRSVKQEIVVLHWTSVWREHRPVQVLSKEQCGDHLENKAFGPATQRDKVFSIPCRITHDRRYLAESDALVSHSFDLMWEELPAGRGGKRNPDQLWVYLQQESPIYTKLNLQAYPDVFNWTMTYRRDSDVYTPYGQLLHKTTPTTPPSNYSDILRQKHGLVAWIVSSCDSHSKREYFVQELQRYIPVAIFGWCGDDCPSLGGNCYSHVQSNYKFYLSFENSLCTDYITEKFFSALASSMVPIVYGGSRTGDYEEIAPKKSYIDARKFKSPRALAEYLLYLDQNDSEYLAYFEWKNHYRLSSSPIGWCNLCQRLYDHLTVSNTTEVGLTHGKKWYKDVWKWWNYMSYDTSMEASPERQATSQTALIGQSYYYKMGAPACLSAPKKFIRGEESSDGDRGVRTGRIKTKPDFEPGFLNGRIFGKLIGWARELI